MIFSGMTSSNTAEYKFYLNSGVIKFQFIIIIIMCRDIIITILIKYINGYFRQKLVKLLASGSFYQ